MLGASEVRMKQVTLVMIMTCSPELSSL